MVGFWNFEKGCTEQARLTWEVIWEQMDAWGYVTRRTMNIEAPDSQRALSRALRTLLHDQKSFKIVEFRLRTDQPREG